MQANPSKSERVRAILDKFKQGLGCTDRYCPGIVPTVVPIPLPAFPPNPFVRPGFGTDRPLVPRPFYSAAMLLAIHSPLSLCQGGLWQGGGLGQSQKPDHPQLQPFVLPPRPSPMNRQRPHITQERHPQWAGRPAPEMHQRCALKEHPWK